MDLYLGAFLTFALVMAGMAIGVILSDRRITGTCGGLNNMTDADGEPMCECGARPGQRCGEDHHSRYDSDDDGDREGLSSPTRHAEPETAAV